MEKPTYKVESSDDGFNYFFDSVSKDQIIQKDEKNNE